MTLAEMTTALVKLLAQQPPNSEVCSAVAELELPIDGVRVVDLLPEPGGKVVLLLTRVEEPSFGVTAKSKTKTKTQPTPELLEAIAARVLLVEVIEGLRRVVIAWDTLHPFVLTTSTKHSPNLLIDAINDARRIVEGKPAAPPS